MKVKSKKRKITKSRMKSCLVIECDHDNLSEQGLCFATELDIHVKKWTTANSKVILTKSKEEIPSEFAKAYDESRHFDVIVLIGHGSKAGIRFSKNNFVDYAVMAKWILPFLPKVIFLVTCEGAHSLPSGVLFQEIKSLREIYGSPVKARKSVFEIIKLILPLILSSKRLDERVIKLIQVANFLQSDGILLHHTRQEFQKKKGEKNLLEALYPHLAEIKSALLGQVRA